MTSSNSEPNGFSRRSLLAGGLLTGSAALLAGCTPTPQVVAETEPPSSEAPTPTRGPVSPFGEHQAGIVAPFPPQAHLTILVCDVEDADRIRGIVDDLGALAAGFSAGDRLRGLDPAAATVTVGVGPRIVRGVFGRSAPGADELPEFARDDVRPEHRGGDLLVQLCTEEPAVAAIAEGEILETIGSRGVVRWIARGFRGRPDHGVGRNLLGFHDGLSVPKTAEDLADDVWLDAPDGLAGGTVAVVRVMPIDVDGFAQKSVGEQEAAVGRHRDTGAPLSGGDIDDDPDLQAKSPDGYFAIANDAHVRRAHPLPAGAPGLMLRRSYSYFNSVRDQGLVFISFQKTLETFIRTQHRIDAGDALLDFASTTATGSFLILPGFAADGSLGAPLTAR